MLELLKSGAGNGRELLALGINKDGPAGILTPSATGEIVFNFQGLPNPSPPLLNFTAKINSEEDDPYDWDARKEALRPPTISVEAWDVIFENFKKRVGETRQSYERALGEVATYLSQIGEATSDVPELLTVLIGQANNAYPGSILAAGFDASAPTAGVLLAFGRVFAQPISARYRLGPLGRGWSHPYEMTFIDDENNFIIRSPLGDRIFEKDSEDPFLLVKARGLFGDPGRLSGFVSSRKSLTEPDGTSYGFDKDGKLVAIVKHNNFLQLEYTDGLLTKLRHRPASTSPTEVDEFTLEHNEFGRISRLTDHAGRVTEYFYDESGDHLIEVTDVSGSVFYTYEIGNGVEREHALSSITDIAGLQLFYSYDEQGRLIGWEREGGVEAVALVYGPEATVSYRNATGATSRVSFNRLGQVVEVRDALGRIVQRRYDENQNPDFDRLPGNLSVDFTYGDHRFLQQSVDAAGETVKTRIGPSFSISIPLNFRLTQVEDELGIRTSYSNSPFGDLLTLRYPDDSTEEFVYDTRGNITHYTNRRGKDFSYAYNTRGQLIQATAPSGTRNLTYDEAGNLLSISDASGETKFAYDNADRLVRVEYPNGRTLNYIYDEAGRRTQLSDQDGFTVNYAYDTLGRLASLTDGSDELIVAYSYDTIGRLEREDHGNGTFATYEYDVGGQLTTIVNHAPDATVNSSFEYVYDDLGRRTEMQTLDGDWTYEFDAVGQLTRAQFNSTNVDISDQDLQYEYDAAGNRIRTILNGEATSYATNNLNQYTQIGDGTYSYDADGNLVAITDASGTTDFTFDDRGRLIQVTDGTDKWVYEYDALGQRVASIHNDERTEYLVDPLGLGNVVGEYDGSGALVARYTQGLGLISRVDSTGTAAFYDYDAIGSTAGLTGSDGGYVNSYSYLPFGDPLAQAETIENTFEYVGLLGVSRDDSGLDYMRARYYSPTDGRFVSADPIGILGGVNLYRYVGNHPIGSIDPSGLAAGGLVKVGTFIAEISLTGGMKIVTRFANTGDDIVRIAKQVLAKGGTLTPEGRAALKLAPKGDGAIPIRNGMDLLIIEASGLGAFAGLLFASEAFANPVSGTINFVSDPSLDTFTAPARDALSEASGFDLGQALVNGFPDLGTFFGGLACELVGCDLPDDGDESETEQVASFDPNDIIGPSGFGDLGFIAPTDEALSYTIRFENLDKATAPAQVVTVTQLLDNDLDLSTFQFDQFGFGDQTYQVVENQNFVEARLDLRETHDIFLDIEGLLNTETRLLTWTFTSIDPTTFDLPLDPFDGFLPPNQNAPEGEGFISYKVKHKQNLPTGTSLDAQASIVFDLNEAILTPAIVNTIDAAAPSSNFEPLPSTTHDTSFTVNWTGEDDANGSGISFFDVFVSTDGSEFVPLLERTTEISVTFEGEDNRTYSFFSVATDNVGHREEVPASADTTTFVSTTDIPVETAPVITSPIGQTSDIQPTIEWTAIDGADRYQVLGYHIERGAEVVNEFVEGTRLSLAEPLLQLGTYQFFVRGIRDLPEDLQEYGPFSLPEHFSIAAANLFFSAPELTGPIPRIGDPTPTITWTGVPGAEAFEMHVYDVAAGKLIFHQTDIAPTHFTLNESLTVGRVYTAYARVDHGNSGEWGGPLAFTVEEGVESGGNPREGQPELTGPLPVINNSHPIITWNEFETAQSYRVEVYDVDRGQRILVADDIAATQFTPGEPLPLISGEYQIFVRANLEEFEVSGFSQPMHTRILQHAPLPARTRLIAPITPTFDDTPTFVWEDAPSAVAYEITIENIDTAEEVLRKSNIVERHFIPKVPLDPGNYRIQVAGLNDFNEPGPPSDPFEFEILLALDEVFSGLPDDGLE